MNTPVTIITTGRVTADLQVKTSQNGKNTQYVQFGLAVNKGFGEKSHPNFYQCILFGEEALRMSKAKVMKGSLIQIIGDLDLLEITRKDGSTGWIAKVTLLSWSYAPTSRPKGETADAETDLPPIENCGQNGLPFQ
ncbi:MAG TPA: single-stranded DNA-binding protein [Candidatus Eisenbergiella merdavium]|uniref:Single-stranded DNA-binding protein n=1 Tax=Candidatus Eisenbergiella merdavium TaxID=2838551 RepID=A0A9D2ND22_9FIRM|nr:single-stranded DNA-binding protein [Candidatus Eisenbergiella merdavium]